MRGGFAISKREGVVGETLGFPTTKSINLSIHGQCVFVFHTKEETHITFYNEHKNDGLIVFLNQSGFLVENVKTYQKYENQCNKKFDNQCETLGFTQKSGAYYWFSLDSQNQRLYAGVGEPRIETACFVYAMNIADKPFLESITSIFIPDTMKPIRLLKNPITRSVPLYVKSIHEITMNDIAENRILPSTSLSTASQMLYGCIAGDKFVLNTPDFPDFSDAIEYSIRTEGLWCNTRLKQKSTEFGENPQPLETYLRITLGENNGESPGIPYVMEIWPVGHYSPVHNHGGANAIIRVLHGKIQVSLYPYLCDEPQSIKPFATTEFEKGDITWISPTLNQVHQLKNLESNNSACITIQCYMYDENDRKHYDYFDYLGDNNEKKQYEPDSDMDFIEFKKMIMDEWRNRPNTENSLKQSSLFTRFVSCELFVL